MYICRMKRYLAPFCIALTSILSACSDDSSSSGNNELSLEYQQYEQDRDAINSVLKQQPTLTLYVKNAGEQDRPFYGGNTNSLNWQNRHFEDTIQINSYVTDIYYTVFFQEESECSFSDVEFYWNGKKTEASQIKGSYDQDILAVHAPETINTQEHVLEVKMDSAKCANISETFHFTPGYAKPIAYTGKVIYETGERKCKWSFYEDMYASIYQLGSKAIYVDSVRSECFMKKSSESKTDSIKLAMSFDERGLTALSSPTHAQAFLSGEKLTSFIGNDSTATISIKCGLVYQTSPETVDPENLEYSEKEIQFEPCFQYSITDIALDDSLRVTTRQAVSMDMVFGKIKIDGTSKYFIIQRSEETPFTTTYTHTGSCEPYVAETCSTFVHYPFDIDEVCGADCQKNYDSLQVIARFASPHPSYTFNEYLANVYLPRFEYLKDTLAIDSLINAMTDAQGNILPDYTMYSAIRIANPSK